MFDNRSVFSRFDYLVWAIVGVLIALIAGLIIRGDQVGVTVVAFTPAADGEASTRSWIRLQFADELVDVPDDAVVLSPPVAGETTLQGNSLMFRPDMPLGANQTYQVTVQPGITDRNGRELREAITWQFTTTGPRILFIGLSDEAPNQLYLADPNDREPPRPLTQAAGSVLDFAVAPDGSRIVYTVSATDEARLGASDLWVINADGSGGQELLNCELAACSRPVWHPDGERLVYERRQIPAPGQPPNNPRLWWLDAASGQTVSVFSDSQLLGLSASFSADGQWLSYISTIDRGIQLYNLLDGSGAVIRNRIGAAAVWSPAEPLLAVADIFPEGESFQSLISVIDAASGRTQTISTPLYDELIDDAGPAWSPDGRQLAFGRKDVLTAGGRQLWIMRNDGSDPMQLTAEPDWQHAVVSWSPDGLSLVYQLFDIKELYARTGIWVLDIGSGEAREIYKPGSQPAWLP